MADPQALYVVTAVVVSLLVLWVLAVNLRAPTFVAKMAGRASARPGSADGTPAKEDAKPFASRPAMQSHQEIQDDAAATANVADEHDADEEEEPTGPHALILVTAVGRTDAGRRRPNNDDAYLILPEHHLLVIADGMTDLGAAAKSASNLLVETMDEAFRADAKAKEESDPSLAPRANRLRNAVLLANERIYARTDQAHRGTGTTVVAAFFSPNKQKVYIAHVGDSRCYRVRKGGLEQLTVDHTLGAAGIQGSTASLLSRAVGVKEAVEVDVTTDSPMPGDIYLLCSDGLSGMATNEEILAAIQGSVDLDAAAARLIELANARGGKDNITAILAGIKDAPAFS